jgi:hypothetical protein
VFAGEWGLTVVGAEQLSGGGYEVALRQTGTNQYTVWNTDSNGNEVSSAIGGVFVSGTSGVLESLEASFHQDLNGDGTIGLVGTTIESSGSTSLLQVGSNYFFVPVGGGTGPELTYNGAPVFAGEWGLTVVGAEQLAGGGYEVALRQTGTNQYTVWNTDSNGNEVSSAIGGGYVSGTSSVLESLEASFHQDLNGDGAILLSGTGSSIGTSSIVVGSGASVELTGAYSGSITFAGATGSVTIDDPEDFSGKIGGQLAIGDVIDLAGITAGSSATLAYSGNNSPGMLTVSDGIHTANIALLGNYSLANFTVASDGHGGTSLVDPPIVNAESSAIDQQLALLSQYTASELSSTPASQSDPATLNSDQVSGAYLVAPTAAQQHTPLTSHG